MLTFHTDKNGLSTLSVVGNFVSTTTATAAFFAWCTTAVTVNVDYLGIRLSKASEIFNAFLSVRIDWTTLF